MDRLSFTAYLASAHQAKQYVSSKMDLGANDSVGNMLSKAVIGNIAVKWAVNEVRANVDKDMALRKKLDPRAQPRRGSGWEPGGLARLHRRDGVPWGIDGRGQLR